MVRRGDGPPPSAYTVLPGDSSVKESRRPHQCNLCEHAPFSKKESYDKHWKREHQPEDNSSRNLLNFWRHPQQRGSEAVAAAAAGPAAAPEPAAAPATAPVVPSAPVAGPERDTAYPPQGATPVQQAAAAISLPETLTVRGLRSIVNTALEAQATAGIFRPQAEDLGRGFQWFQKRTRELREEASADPNENIEEKMQSARSVEALAACTPDLECRGSDENLQLVCLVCEGHSAHPVNKWTFKGTQRFANLKHSVKSHFTGIDNAHSQALRNRERERRRLRDQKKIGMNVARAALQTVREAGSYSQFPNKLLDLHLSGVLIGSKNHSREFIRNFIESMYTVVTDRIGTYLALSTPSHNGLGCLP